MNDISDWLNKFSLIVMCFIGGFVAGVLVQRHYECNTSTNVENITKIDSLTTVNDSIKIKVEKLDSIKDAKIIEVSTLDNDSTLKLFYELVSE